MSEEYYDPITGEELIKESITDVLVGRIIDSCTGMYAPKPVNDWAVLVAMTRSFAFGLTEMYQTDELAMKKINEIMPRLIAEERENAANLPEVDDDGNLPTLN